MMESHFAAERVHDEALDSLLARGWCHSYSFTDGLIIRIAELARAELGDELDLLMAEFTRRQIDSIRKTACEKYPLRSAILTDAFDAHRAGKYTLSVPTLLPQLDGIGCEVMGLGRNFFAERRRADALAGILQNFQFPSDGRQYPIGGIDERMLAAVERTWSLTLDTNRRRSGTEYCPLNRHGVLHGLDTDYATEFNSLRCILLIGYMLEVRQVLHEDIPSQLRGIQQFFARLDQRA